ncbi:protein INAPERTURATE POLLEN1 [Impatiens glandulifera]|uniref:protein INAPERTURATE POLLEN1 n=1 Tax=Impatiens glandulifera TaxID=253017 RepID=UPI001FB1557D|nr:protein INAPERTURATE POLLEN1 [Impatiens glandulifera]
MKSLALFRRKNRQRNFKPFYEEWIQTLRDALLPQLRRSISSTVRFPHFVSSDVESIHSHFISYYDALDLAASDDASQVLIPDWRNPLEKPFIWLGDLHPYLFINLLRSFIIGEDPSNHTDRNWQISTAWKSPTRELSNRVDEIERGLRLMVPALVSRAREAQGKFVKKVAVDWRRKEVVGKAVGEEMEEMGCVVVDANRLRRSVLADILVATNVYQAAVFLEGLAQFVVGFRDGQLMAEFDRCEAVDVTQ